MKDLVDEDNELELAAKNRAGHRHAGEGGGRSSHHQARQPDLDGFRERGASDIHIEPYELEMRVRFRIDGQLATVMTPPLRSRMRLQPLEDHGQTGHCGKAFAARRPHHDQVQADARKGIGLRVSTCPPSTAKVVMRLLDKENLRLDMTKLGFEPESLKKFERNILKPYGMVLVTGPTGSVKRTRFTPPSRP